MTALSFHSLRLKDAIFVLTFFIIIQTSKFAIPQRCASARLACFGDIFTYVPCSVPSVVYKPELGKAMWPLALEHFLRKLLTGPLMQQHVQMWSTAHKVAGPEPVMYFSHAEIAYLVPALLPEPLEVLCNLGPNDLSLQREFLARGQRPEIPRSGCRKLIYPDMHVWTRR